MPYDHTKYNIQYAKENTRRIAFSLNKNTDADIIEYIETVGNINGYLKQLIRQDMRSKVERNDIRAD